MTEFENLINQMNLSRSAIEEMKSQQSMIDKTISIALKKCPEDQKDKMLNLKNLSQKVVNLAKEGKTEKALKLIKQFENECKN
ncbi:hypothetical protein HWC99_gp52 [Flavobacterium phage vB_FspS_tant8-1]|uniref:Uncharacterized protein n=1 Tax=Flavobacterium phage vB_FspS_tant8-1 TaxID=2686278 RepID=A0A6B9LIZ8_9CAUD|nr:hypothetical protein HWC99_gp52 [Flavobacterium phage vB_FspS_tant8-1]QHB40983.1 hypothetical protein tant81_gp052 [Flavobacterium phage vB_FspS_tant8-1]